LFFPHFSIFSLTHLNLLVVFSFLNIVESKFILLDSCLLLVYFHYFFAQLVDSKLNVAGLELSRACMVARWTLSAAFSLIGLSILRVGFAPADLIFESAFPYSALHDRL